jgi:hypothetical protein
MSQQIVAAVKADLEARGVSLVGPCGAFQIVKRVAWALRATDAGLLSKPTGNNCEGFATDIIAYPDGRIFDVLENGGGDEYPEGHPQAGQPIPGTGNGPVWNPPSDGQHVDPSRYRRPFDPGDDVVEEQPAGEPVSEPGSAPTDPPAPRGDLAAVLAQLATLQTALQQLRDRPVPIYRGTATIFGQKVTVTLTPTDAAPPTTLAFRASSARAQKDRA